MTCIVGIKTDAGQVLIAGDSAGTAGTSLQVRADPKVFLKDDVAFGFTSSFRMGDILRWSLSLPKRHNDDDLDQWMRVEFIDAVRACLKCKGFAKVDSGVERGGVFLVGIAGRLFNVDSDYQVGEVVDRYIAVGCGEDLAMGALHALFNPNVGDDGPDPEEAATRALEAAAYHNSAVCAPFRFVVTGTDGIRNLS